MARRNLWIVLGQSNEVGAWQDPPATPAPQAHPGPILGDPIGPHGGADGSMWPGLFWLLWQTQPQLRVTVRNVARGGTGIVGDWVGLEGSAAAQPGDAGYDPNGYIADALAEGIRGTLRTWARVDVAINWGQNDATNARTLAQWFGAHEVLIDQLLALDSAPSVWVGTSFYYPGQASWYNTVGIPGIASVLANYASNPRVQAGANMAVALGSHVTLRDTVHADATSYERGVSEWARVLRAGGYR